MGGRKEEGMGGQEVQEMGCRIWGYQQDRVWLQGFRECWRVPEPPGAVSEGEMRDLP